MHVLYICTKFLFHKIELFSIKSVNNIMCFRSYCVSVHVTSSLNTYFCNHILFSSVLPCSDSLNPQKRASRFFYQNKSEMTSSSIPCIVNMFLWDCKTVWTVHISPVFFFWYSKLLPQWPTNFCLQHLKMFTITKYQSFLHPIYQKFLNILDKLFRWTTMTATLLKIIFCTSCFIIAMTNT